MFGGNDAINTLVPAEDDRYYSKYRIKTNLPKSNLVKLSNGKYFNKALSYGAKGGISFHYVADNYIAFFSTFMACGVWEAVAIIEGLLKNLSQLQRHLRTMGMPTI